ncbi:MAG: rhodanese-like domain-containing protein, partial [Campylobacteraceae bacterium]|nr:rhodanese-like domain-containing protein [Campylobacteraceae bacterium]
LSLLLILGFTSFAMASKSTTPTSTDKAKYVSVQEAKVLFDKGIQFCDARKPIEYAQEKIKGAISTFYNEKGGKKNKKAVWDTSKDKFDLSKLPATCVYYCNGPACWKGYKAAVTAQKNGKTAYWLRDGIPGWKAAGFPTE